MRRRRRTGMILVYSAVIMSVLIGFAGLAIDMSYSNRVAAQMQTAADASALAAAQLVTANQTTATQAASTIAGSNSAAGTMVKLANADIVLGQWNAAKGTFTATTVSPNAVQVTVNRTTGSPAGGVPLVFGPLYGVSTVSLTRSAIAINTTINNNDGLIALNPSANPSVSMTGNGSITINGGDVQIDSSGSSALSMTGNGNITAGNVNIVGGDSFKGNAGVTGNLKTGASSVADPYANLPAPTKGTDLGTVKLTGNTSTKLQPGYYSGGIASSGNGSLTLNPGVYVLGGAGINITGNGSLTANGVTFYITGTGTVNLTGNGAVNLTPPTSGTYQGISLFLDRSSSVATKITGNGNLNLAGVIYMPGSSLDLTGNGDTIGSQIIVDTLRLTGNGSVTVNHSGAATASSSSYLVQ